MDKSTNPAIGQQLQMLAGFPVYWVAPTSEYADTAPTAPAAPMPEMPAGAPMPEEAMPAEETALPPEGM